MEFVAWTALALASLNVIVLVLVLREIAILRASGGGRRSGLKLDETLPNVTVRTLGGGTISLVTLRRTLLLLVSADCALCRTLVGELRQVPQPSLPPLIIGVTSHTEVDEKHPFLTALDFVEPSAIILDDRRELFARVEAPVTPWAYALNADGRIRGSGVPRSVSELTEMATAVA